MDMQKIKLEIDVNQFVLIVSMVNVLDRIDVNVIQATLVLLVI